MNITLRQIAERVGVSNQVVSKVLNGGTSSVNASAATRKRILAAAREMGYRPNASARSIRCRQFHQVGLSAGMRGGQSLLNVHVVDGCLDELEKRDVRLSIERIDEQRLIRDSTYVPRLFREASLDGLLLSYCRDMPQRLDALLEGLGAPIVYINRRLSHNAVYPDQEAAGRMLTEQALRLGHRRIIYVGAPILPSAGGHHAHLDRPAGYQQAMRAAGFREQFINDDTFVRRNAPEDLDRIKSDFIAPLTAQFRRADRPTAAICYNLDLAAAVWEAAREAGLRIPDDLSLCCFGEGAVAGRQMTCYVQPYREVGRASALMLSERIENPASVLPSVALVGAIRAGDTVGPAPEK